MLLKSHPNVGVTTSENEYPRIIQTAFRFSRWWVASVLQGRKHRSKSNSLHWQGMAQHLAGLSSILLYTKQSQMKVEVKQILASGVIK